MNRVLTAKSRKELNSLLDQDPDLILRSVVEKRYDVLQHLVFNLQSYHFSDDDLWQTMNQHDFTAVKIMLPMYQKDPNYLVNATEVSSPEIVQLLLDEGFPVNSRILYCMYFNNAKRENLLLVLHHYNPEMTLTDFLIQNENFDNALNEIDKYPITIINNQTLRFAIFGNNFKLMKSFLESGNFDKSDIRVILSAIDLNVIYVKTLLAAGFSFKTTDINLRSDFLRKLLSEPFEIFLLFADELDLSSRIIFENRLITPIEYVIRCGTLDILKAIVESGVKPNCIDVEVTNDPLILLAAKKAKFDMVEYLLPETQYVNRIDIDGFNLVSYVLWYKHENVELLEKLIEHGAHLDHLTRLPFGNEIVNFPPLLLAAEREKIKSIEILIKHGCDINFTLANNWNAFTMCGPRHAEKILQLGFSATWESNTFYTAGIWAAMSNWNRDIQLACIKYLPHQINQFKDITFVAATSDVIVVKELLAAGADVNLGRNPFINSVVNRHPEDKLLILLELGVRPIHTSNLSPVVQEALYFWNLPKEERLKYSLKDITRLCPLYRENINLLHLRESVKSSWSLLPNELLGEIAKYM